MIIRNINGELEYHLTFYRPFAGSFRITSKFGKRRLKNFFQAHKGTDYVGLNKNIHSIGKAKVLRIGYQENGAGNYIVCNSNWYNDDIEVKYFHLSEVFVKQGEILTKDSVIGIEGSTGHSTGSHLHLEIWYNGKPLDPEGNEIQWIARK